MGAFLNVKPCSVTSAPVRKPVSENGGRLQRVNKRKGAEFPEANAPRAPRSSRHERLTRRAARRRL